LINVTSPETLVGGTEDLEAIPTGKNIYRFLGEFDEGGTGCVRFF
jgi:hypothetical protein